LADPRVSPARPDGATGVIVFADGRTIWGRGFGAEGQAVGELCFNTAMTGYQEVMTDPSYALQVIAFTFPHIGNVGANEEDVEADEAHALGCIVREAVTGPSNFRAGQDYPSWMAATGRIGISGVDTRALTRLVRREGPPTIAIAHSAKGEFDLDALQKMAADWPGLEGMDLAKEVSRDQLEAWSGGKWELGQGYRMGGTEPDRPHVVAIDYGSKRNIFRNLVEAGARVTVLPAGASVDEVMAQKPDGFFLSNGPGDPAAVEGVRENVRELAGRYPMFGICLGHQILGLALGGTTRKLKFGHHGGNQPGQDLATGKVAICAENHGYAVEADSLRQAGEAVEITHVNLNDDTVEGLAHAERPLFSVQYHPEASPGPHDAGYFFGRFREMVARHTAGERVSGAAVAKGS